jgi:hypothetical protein
MFGVGVKATTSFVFRRCHGQPGRRGAQDEIGNEKVDFC